MDGSPRVRIGIVSWNTRTLLDRCLASLPAAIAGYPSETVVVDNASHDGSADVARSHPGVVVMANRINVGYARAMNQALGENSAEVLIALNPDTEPAPGSLASLVDRLLAAGDVGLVVPRLVNSDGSPQHSAYRFPSALIAAAVCFLPAGLHRGAIGRRLWLEGSGMPRSPSDIDWAVGAVHVIRTAACAGRPPYDERWFMYVEDLELCWRLARSGWRRRIESGIVITHVGNASGAQAWGRTQASRWLDATYDWYARDRGEAAMRLYATINTVGVVVHLLAISAASLLGPRDRLAERQHRIKTLVRALPRHLRAAVLGPSPLPDGVSP